MSALPKLATFCPRCGLNLKDFSPPSLEPRGEAPRGAVSVAEMATSRPAYWVGIRPYLSNLVTHLLRRNRPQPPDVQVHSLMLTGYGNAMVNLGWRYERGRGVLPNFNEAFRCYRKAANLGNRWARWRVGQILPGRGGTVEPLRVLPVEAGDAADCERPSERSI